MKKVKYVRILLTATAVFFMATFLSARIETPFDGNDTYGFPLVFFTRFSGECGPCPPEPTALNYGYLSVDIIFAIAGGLLLLYIFTQARKTVISRKAGN